MFARYCLEIEIVMLQITTNILLIQKLFMYWGVTVNLSQDQQFLNNDFP